MIQSTGSAAIQVLVFGLLASAACAATVTWDGGAGTNSWHDAANWNPDGIPAAADDVIISVQGSMTIAHTVGTSTIKSLLSYQSVSISTNSTLNLNETSSTFGLVLSSAGKVGGPGDLYITGTAIWNSGGMLNGGRTVITASASLEMNANHSRYLARELRNEGVAHWSQGPVAFDSGVFVNHGTFIVDARPSSQTLAASGGPGWFHNYGTLAKRSAGNVSFREGNGPMTFNNSGRVLVETGNLFLNHGVHSGEFVVAQGALLYFSSDESITFTAESSLHGQGSAYFEVPYFRSLVIDGDVTLGGEVEFDSGLVTVNGQFRAGHVEALNDSMEITFNDTFEAELQLDARVFFNGSESVALSGVMDGGVIGGHSPLIVDRTFVWNGGTIESAGGLQVTASGTLAGVRTIKTSITNDGVLNIPGSVEMQNAEIVNRAVMNLVTSNVYYAERVIQCIGGHAEIHNHGAIVKSGIGRVLIAEENGGVSLHNVGSVTVLDGLLVVDGGGSSSGEMNVLDGATLGFASEYVHERASRLTGAGTIHFVSGVHDIQGNYACVGSLQLGGAQVTLRNACEPSGIWANDSTGRLEVEADQDWQCDLNVQCTLGGSGDIELHGFVHCRNDLEGMGTCHVAADGELRLSGDGDEVALRKPMVISGILDVREQVVNVDGVTVINMGEMILGNAGMNAQHVHVLSGDGRVWNTGTLRKIGVAVCSFECAADGNAFVNDGVVSIEGGTLVLNADSAGTGAYVVASGGSLKCGADCHADVIECHGELIVGEGAQFSLQHALSQEATGLMRLSVSRNMPPPLVCSGSVSLLGGLAAMVEHSVAPLESVELMWSTNQRISGEFEAHACYPVGSISYEPQVITYTRFAPGDVNGDNIVGIDDLLAVINGWGNCPAPPAQCPDLDGNGIINIDDLLMIINNWPGP